MDNPLVNWTLTLLAQTSQLVTHSPPFVVCSTCRDLLAGVESSPALESGGARGAAGATRELRPRAGGVRPAPRVVRQ